MYISPFVGSPTPIGYSPDQIRTAYGLPSSGGAGTTIAIVDAYDIEDILNYFNTFSSQYNLQTNNTGNFIVFKMPGTAPPPPSNIDWQLEACLDVEWAHAIAPDAKILLVEATSASDSDLLSAVDYATSQPGVVAVSMSWGNNEFSSETSSSFENHFNKPGITFFAASGDDGTYVNWPAASAKVVSVGGTTLNLNSAGKVISETAWGNSSGGVSNYVTKPIFQTNYGLTYPNRAVPDVSYVGDANTGVAVYNGTWWKVGGTSAGAPQWAAIHALGLSTTNYNLYARATSVYSSYFRDITAGSNYNNSSTTSYDLVTGLGSPVTFNFGALTVTPNSGPSGGLITLSGIGITPNSSVNITYLNPTNSSWIPLIDNYETAAGAFTYSFNAPDLLRNNPAGDNQPQFDKIIFRAQDNSNRRYYNTTVPYTEWRRGLTQLSDTSATGLFGSNTNLATLTFVQNHQSIIVAGQWFNPVNGSASLQWDDKVSLGTAAIDKTGFLNATVQVPTTAAGQHILTINDGNSNFCVNLTRLPIVANDYAAGWHTSNITINLTSDYPVNETFYSINGGPVFNVTANGLPTITVEGDSNTLEYWSTWNVYETGLGELPHSTLTGIQLDKTAPTGTMMTAVTTTSPTVTLTLSTAEDISGISQMSFSNDNKTWSNWEPYTSSTTWTLQGGDGQKTVYAQYIDNAGLTSPIYSYTLTLETLQSTVTPTPTPSPTPTSSPTASLTPEPTLSTTPTSTPTTFPEAVVPEIPAITAILTVLAAATLVVVLKKRRK